jgi:ribosomal protein L17
MARLRRKITVAGMTAHSHHRDSSAARLPLANMYEDLRRRNERRADLARAREMRARIERALQAARQRTTRDRG